MAPHFMPPEREWLDLRLKEDDIAEILRQGPVGPNGERNSYLLKAADVLYAEFKKRFPVPYGGEMDADYNSRSRRSHHHVERICAETKESWRLRMSHIHKVWILLHYSMTILTLFSTSTTLSPRSTSDAPAVAKPPPSSPFPKFRENASLALSQGLMSFRGTDKTYRTLLIAALLSLTLVSFVLKLPRHGIPCPWSYARRIKRRRYVAMKSVSAGARKCSPLTRIWHRPHRCSSFTFFRHDKYSHAHEDLLRLLHSGWGRY